MGGWITRFDVVAIVAFLTFGIFFSPEALGSISDDEDRYSRKQQLTIIALKLAHLLSFSTAWGAVLWAIFISGLIMFKNLPRHRFGHLRSKMFPVCFSMVTVCSAISLASFSYLYTLRSSSSSVEMYHQLGFLFSSLAFNLSNMFYFTPKTLAMMKQRQKVEREEGIGKEIGWGKNREIAKVNSKLAAMNKKFHIIHAFSVLVTCMSFSTLAIHSWYLAAKINF